MNLVKIYAPRELTSPPEEALWSHQMMLQLASLDEASIVNTIGPKSRSAGISDLPQNFAEENDRARLSPAALRAMKSLTEQWTLKGPEVAALLGVSTSTWDRMSAGR